MELTSEVESASGCSLDILEEWEIFLVEWHSCWFRKKASRKEEHDREKEKQILYFELKKQSETEEYCSWLFSAGYALIPCCLSGEIWIILFIYEQIQMLQSLNSSLGMVKKSTRQRKCKWESRNKEFVKFSKLNKEGVIKTDPIQLHQVTNKSEEIKGPNGHNSTGRISLLVAWKDFRYLWLGFVGLIISSLLVLVLFLFLFSFEDCLSFVLFMFYFINKVIWFLINPKKEKWKKAQISLEFFFINHSVLGLISWAFCLLIKTSYM